MAPYRINPLADPRWDDLVARHPSASVFHQRGWLEALHRTYGYEPFVLTRTPPGTPLQNGILLCKVSSWLTGTRLVSVPFADHCEPLWDMQGESADYSQWLRAEAERHHAKYVEVRPLCPLSPREGNLQPSHSYCFHELDLRLTESELFARLHKDSIQRKIRRAEREQLACESGRSGKLQDEFYRLLLFTRRRHRLPPQPRAWFHNLIESVGDQSLIRVARHNGTAIAAILTLRHASTVVYKYGCSDERFHQLGAMPFLFWRLIQESKASGAETIDFGRSDADNEGLITFKDHWGTAKRTLIYYRHPERRRAKSLSSSDSSGMRQIFAMLPDSFLSIAGRLLYRHMG
ncbi:MAG TPA: GNAT family N-acetyltransferase [Terriglobales bacterium]|nr:GNAT family N-acetyltransferase [Terriglobales bacterium]